MIAQELITLCELAAALLIMWLGAAAIVSLIITCFDDVADAIKDKLYQLRCRNERRQLLYVLRYEQKEHQHA